MNHTQVIRVWKGTDRFSRFWEELAANYVAPDPVRVDRAVPREGVELAILGEAESASREETFLEKASQEWIQWIRHTFETLTTSPEEEPLETSDPAGVPQPLPILLGGMEKTLVRSLPLPADLSSPLDMVRVSSESEEQSASVIDTRRMAYGLKIPRKPLHKRPIHQRLFFCLRQIINRGNESSLTR